SAERSLPNLAARAALAVDEDFCHELGGVDLGQIKLDTSIVLSHLGKRSSEPLTDSVKALFDEPTLVEVGGSTADLRNSRSFRTPRFFPPRGLAPAPTAGNRLRLSLRAGECRLLGRLAASQFQPRQQVALGGVLVESNQIDVDDLVQEPVGAALAHADRHERP